MANRRDVCKGNGQGVPFVGREQVLDLVSVLLVVGGREKRGTS